MVLLSFDTEEFDVPREHGVDLLLEEGMVVPVTPWLRFLQFRLSLHNHPEWLYHRMVRRILCHDGHFVTYLHLWDFYELRPHLDFKMPLTIWNHSGQQMMDRLDRLIKMQKQRGHEFITNKSFYAYETCNDCTPGIQ